MGIYGIDPMNTSNAPAYHTLANVKAGRGDICRLVGMTAAEIALMQTDDDLYAREAELATQGIGGWRLPTTWENYRFVGYDVADTYTPNTTENRSNSSDKYWVTNTTTPASSPQTNAGVRRNGGYFPTGTSTMWTANSYFLPAAGYRYSSNGSVYSQGAGGDYWSSTAYSSASGYYLGFSSTGVSPSGGIGYAYGFGVRCVRPE